MVCCWFPIDVDREALCAAAMPLDPTLAAAAQVRLVPEDPTAWQAALADQPPFALGGFTVVATPDERAGFAPGAALCLRPGLAFGGGQHPTTAACVAALEARPMPRRVLDVGTGTGVLALVAAQRGAERVVGTDIDPLARAAARAHAALNGLVDRVTVQTELPPPAPGFGLVVANLYLGPLLALLPALADRVAPAGGLIVSGFTAVRAAEVEGRAAALGLRPVATHAVGRWRALSFEREEDR